MKIRIELSLSETGSPPSACKVYVDQSDDDQLDASEELTMYTSDGKNWVRTATVNTESGALFWTQWIAPRGVDWSFTIRDDESDEELYSKSGAMKSTKETLVGRLG